MGTLALTKSSNFAVHDCSSQHDLQVKLDLVITPTPYMIQAFAKTCCMKLVARCHL